VQFLRGVSLCQISLHSIECDEISLDVMRWIDLHQISLRQIRLHENGCDEISLDEMRWIG